MEIIKFSFWEKLTLLCSCFRRKNRKKKNYEKIFEKGEQMVKKELNLYTILESLMKMKASLTVLIGMQDDEKMLQKI